VGNDRLWAPAPHSSPSPIPTALDRLLTANFRNRGSRPLPAVAPGPPLRPFEHTVDRREQSRRKLHPVINGIDQGITFGVVEVGSKGISPHRGAPRCRRCGEDSWFAWSGEVSPVPTGLLFMGPARTSSSRRGNGVNEPVISHRYISDPRRPATREADLCRGPHRCNRTAQVGAERVSDQIYSAANQPFRRK